MEPPQHYHHQHQADQENGNNKSGSGGYTCRQTSTRWTPTTEQIRVLKDLYYNKGVRSPTADQIQKISTTLKQYGKIEGKNVFYWFQNHKARERQKMRFNGTPMATTPTSSSANSVMMASDHYHHPLLHHHHHRHGVSIQRPASVKLDQENHLLHQNRSYSSFNNGNSNHASSGTECGSANASNGYMSSHVYGSMEQEFPVSYNNVGGGWTNNMDHTHHYSAPAYNFFDRPKPLFGLDGYQEEGYGGGGDAYLEHRRTLPLFPMRGEDHINGGGGAIWKHDQSDGRDTYDRDPCASLKLCLNSYAGVGPN